MTSITGNIVVKETAKDGVEDFVTIDGSEFGLEEGGEWTRWDDGTWVAGFIFKAFQECYAVLLQVSMVGYQVQSYEAKIVDIDSVCLEEKDIQQICIEEDNLDVSNLEPPQEE